MLGGKKVYGDHNPAGVGYRNNKPKVLRRATTPKPNAVMSGDYCNGGCCFDYGNMETKTHDYSEGTMEAIYFGNCTIGGKGAGKGPWVHGRSRERSLGGRLQP